jgi:hypothetical protein
MQIIFLRRIFEGSRAEIDSVASAREIPSTSLRAGSSLRLKNGSASDDVTSARISHQPSEIKNQQSKITNL